MKDKKKRSLQIFGETNLQYSILKEDSERCLRKMIQLNYEHKNKQRGQVRDGTIQIRDAEKKSVNKAPDHKCESGGILRL